MVEFHRFTGVLALVLASSVAVAETPYERMLGSKKEFWDYLESRARTVTLRGFEETQSRTEWEKVRTRRLQELRDMLGITPSLKHTPLNPVVTGVLDQGDYTIEKLAFESMPKVYVTGNLYLPKRRDGKVPAIVYVCGHAGSPHGAKTVYQRHGISLAKNGYAALLVDPIQIAETFALHHGPYSLEMHEWYSRGYTPGGVEAWNAIRAVDYLMTRPEVDGARIGITGRSGGAATSWFAGALDPRIKVVCPVMGLGTYTAHVHTRTAPRHCDCMFPINVFGQEGVHQAALIAPRPVLMAHGSKDVLFPGYADVEKGLRSLYSSYGQPENFDSIVVDTGHADSDFLRERAIRWFDRYFFRDPNRTLDMGYTDLSPEKLAVFPDGPPEDALNFRLHEIFAPSAKPVEYTNSATWEKRRSELMSQLRSNVFPTLPASTPDVTVERVQQEPDVPEGYENLRITAKGFAPVRALVRRPKKRTTPAPALILVAADGDSPRSLNALLSAVNARDNAVRVLLFPIGVSEVPWDRDFWNQANRQAMHVGETIDSIRLSGVLMGVQALRQDARVAPDEIMVAGRSTSGVLALYAGILDSRVHQVMMIDAPESHLSGPIFLNVLRYTDIPEAAALLAPRHLTFYSRMPRAYTHTQSVYRLVGHASDVSVSMQIHRVLEGRYDHRFPSGL